MKKLLEFIKDKPTGQKFMYFLLYFLGKATLETEQQQKEKENDSK